jgi:hypothetical protein
MDTPTSTRSSARRPTIGLVVAVLVLAAALALASCSGGGDDKAAPTSTTAAPKTSVDIRLGDVSADSAGAPVTISGDQSQKVLDALTTYVKGATLEPLRSGKPASADFGAIFDAATLASATTADRSVLLDEGLPKVTGDLSVTALPVNLRGLGDQSGNLDLITAALAVDAKGATGLPGAAPLHVVRRADFTLQPDGAGGWKITAYDVVVARDGADLSPTTTTAAAAGARAAGAAK